MTQCKAGRKLWLSNLRGLGFLSALHKQKCAPVSSSDVAGGPWARARVFIRNSTFPKISTVQTKEKNKTRPVEPKPYCILLHN